MVDGEESDDKIIGVLENDLIWGSAREVTDLPHVLIERFGTLFPTYKLVPGQDAKAPSKRCTGRSMPFGWCGLPWQIIKKSL